MRDADSLLISGGAGLSASAGLDYTSTSVCSRLFPSMAQHGFRRMYDALGRPGWTPEVQWGYLLHQVFLARFAWPCAKLYEQLREMSEQLPHDRSFVYTSNADGLFEQHGFDTERIYTVQGDYSRMQCLRPCAADSVWPTRGFIDAALGSIDPHTQALTDPKLVPRCPRCSGPMMLNVRGGNWFIEETVHGPARARYLTWLQAALARATPERPLVLLELGAGFNTPTVVRLPMERLAAGHAGSVRLIRVNAMHSHLPAAVERACFGVGLAGDAAEVVNALHHALQLTEEQRLGNTSAVESE